MIDSTIEYTVLRDHKELFKRAEKYDQHIRLSENYSVYLRRETTDMDVFYQIFFRHYYKIPFKVNFPIENVIDAGANVGLFSLWCITTMPYIKKIISIEPELENHKQILQNAVKNGMSLQKKVKVISLLNAVSDKPGNVSILKDGWRPGAWAYQTIPNKKGPVVAKSMKQLMDEHFPGKTIDLCKIDIEGMEKNIFSAPDAQEWIKRCRIIFVECHDICSPGATFAVEKALTGWRRKTVGDAYCFINPALTNNYSVK